jgi:hypothetical protein
VLVTYSYVKWRLMLWAMHAATATDRKGAWKVLVGTRKGTRLLGREKVSWEDNISIDLQEIQWWSRNVLIWLRIGKSGDSLIGNEFPAFKKPGIFLTT